LVGGKVSLGIEVNIMVAAIERVRFRGGVVIAQINKNMPYTFGDGEIDAELIDFAIEVDQDLPSPFSSATDIVAEAVGEYVAEIVGDGSTLQLGIGAIPDAALAALTHRKGLALWSEMFSDGVLTLERKGATDQSRPIVASFLFGSPELYGWVDKNPRVRLFRTEVTNDPVRIAQHHQMTAINTAIQVDLFAQANANHVRGRIYSGFGGQTDFTVGALHSKGGNAVIALGSWHPKTDSSTVVGCINGPVTSFQHSALVTEWGSAHILGRSQRAQARLIIENIAHPRAKDELKEKALHLGLT
jgi:acyl-CoA hydrolase